ncbi:hypothetical protein [Streptomyces barkulensis]|uniref:hypothetical protein n=1 Tax=Streptomyces barkulensis TaxID=1257026 RepID=UPI001F116C91|nr:hypothetical protein [Streptomyces barkulensis]
MTRGRRRDIAVYGMFTLLGTAAVAWTVITGLVQLDLLGNAVQVRLTECHQEGGGRAGSHSVCSGPQVGSETRTVEIRYEGRPGEVVRAAQKPWGSYVPVETGFVAWGIWVLAPVVCLMGTVAAGALTGREIRRVRQRFSGHGRSSGARSGHGDDDDGSSGAVAPV